MSGIIVCRHRSDEDYRKVVACRFQAYSLIDFCYIFLINWERISCLANFLLSNKRD